MSAAKTQNKTRARRKKKAGARPGVWGSRLWWLVRDGSVRLLGVSLWLVLLGLAIHLLSSASVSALGFESLDDFWRRMHGRLPGGATVWRFAVFLALHAGLIWLWRRVPAQTSSLLARVLTGLSHRVLRPRPRLRALAIALYFVCWSLLVVPLVIQPTMVVLRFDAESWLARAANLLDGTASVTLVEGTIGFYGRLVRPLPALGPAVDDQQKPYALLDRWDRWIAAVARSKHDFALLKAFVWVESGGQQFAVSTTGCLGLLQFCRGTAQLPAYRRIFGRGRFFPCACDAGACIVTRDVQAAVESGDSARLLQKRHAFVCDYADARFDAKRSLAAGLLYIKSLERRFLGNLSLMYIGYNSGPQISARLLRRLGARSIGRLADLERVLPAALRPVYGGQATTRARALVRVHLPKLLHAYRRALGRWQVD